MQESKEAILTLDHIRKLNLCAKGTKSIVVGLYGEDGWRMLVRKGVPVSMLKGATHPDVIKAVNLAKEEFNLRKPGK